MAPPPPFPPTAPPPTSECAALSSAFIVLFIACFFILTCAFARLAIGGLTTTRLSVTLMVLILLASVAAVVVSILTAAACDSIVSGFGKEYSPLLVILVDVLFVVPMYRAWRDMTRRLHAAEGDLEARLLDGSVRLLRVSWLLDQTSDYVLPCRQDLPDAAFWPPDDAVRLLRAGRVAALSYRWLDRGAPDPDAFHLRAVRAFLRQPAVQSRPFTPLPLRRRGPVAALMWDWASLFQEHGGPDDANNEAVPRKERCHKRDSPEQYQAFKAGLGVMSRVYASPRVLVMQHRRLPDDGIARNPYARSGWCQFESEVSALVTVAGGHAVELGAARRAPVRVGQRARTLEEMRDFFRDEEAVTFTGSGDREVVGEMYAELRKAIDEFEDEARGREWQLILDKADGLLTSVDPRRRRSWAILRGVCLLLGIGLLVGGLLTRDSSAQGPLLTFGIILSAVPLLSVCSDVLPSPLLRAHLALALGGQPRDAAVHGGVVRTHSLHWSWWSAPPLRALAGDREVSTARASCFQTPSQAAAVHPAAARFVRSADL